MASLGTSLVMPVALLHPGFGEGLLTGFGEGLLTPPKRSTEGLLIRRETFGWRRGSVRDRPQQQDAFLPGHSRDIIPLERPNGPRDRGQAWPRWARRW